ncbi:MAG TPA: Hpt domain-containing protein [Legionellaceae bacterium]|nr:Hpt domain-containing protein [Legionellaceae bacterium]
MRKSLLDLTIHYTTLTKQYDFYSSLYHGEPFVHHHNGRINAIGNNEQYFFNLQSFTLFDIALGLKNMHASPVLFKEIVTTLLQQDFPAEKKALIEAHTHLNWNNVEKLAHKLKSGSIYMGLRQLQQACQYFEEYYHSGQQTLLEPLYQQILSTLNASQHALEDWINTF